jgi:hypothetical protein
MPTSPNNAASAAQSTGIGGGDAPSTQPKEAASDRRDAAPQAGRSAAGAEREERIREAAYQRYRQRGDRAGEAMDDWLAAEAEIDEADSAQVQGPSERRP